MKKYIKWIMVLFTVLFLFSCKKFLDASAESQVLQEKLFENNRGVHIAVNGIYRLMSGTELYGKNLSWGFISGIGYNYQTHFSLPADIKAGQKFEWQNTSVLTTTEQIWTKAYHAIANCNNIIQEVQPKEFSFFEYGENEKNMILGEMYGVRAMLHFDLLRIFSPAPSSGYKGRSIPYVSHYPDNQPVPQQLDEVLTHIITDMEMAKTLLGPIDTTFLRRVTSTYAGRIRQVDNFINLKEGDFFNYRAQRLNFFAAAGLLARIYLYKEDYNNAYKNAKIVYDFHKRNWFRWTPAMYQGQISDVDYIHTKRPEELLLALSNNRNYDNWDALTVLNGTANQAFRMNSMNVLFQNDLDDYRIVGWFNRNNDQKYLTWVRPKGNSYEAGQVLQNQGPLLPVIRLSEMYHIMIEVLNKQGRVGEAVALLNAVRTARGAKRKIASTVSTSELQEILINDMVRETLTEGQTFFMFKRLNHSIFNGSTSRIMKPEDWSSPIPQSESAYQL